MNNAWKKKLKQGGQKDGYSGSGRCEYDPKQTAAFMMDPAHRATLDETSQHFVSARSPRTTVRTRGTEKAPDR